MSKLNIDWDYWDSFEEDVICAALDATGGLIIYKDGYDIHLESQFYSGFAAVYIEKGFHDANQNNIPWNESLTYKPGCEPI